MAQFLIGVAMGLVLAAAAFGVVMLWPDEDD